MPSLKQLGVLSKYWEGRMTADEKEMIYLTALTRYLLEQVNSEKGATPALLV